MIDEDELKRLETVCAKATSGPWQSGQWKDKPDHFWQVFCDELQVTPCPQVAMKEDARFIAEARTALPRLIEEVRMLKWEIANLKEGRGSYAKPQGQAHAEFIASTKAEIAALQRREPEQEPDCRHEYSRLGGTGWWQCKICYHETDSPSFRIGARDRKREPVNPPRCTACGQSLSSFHPHVCKEA